MRSQECITPRHLLEKTIANVKDTFMGKTGNIETHSIGGRCESISAFVVELERILQGKGKFILVFDGIDHQREAAPTLLPTITRLGERASLSVFAITEQYAE